MVNHHRGKKANIIKTLLGEYNVQEIKSLDDTSRQLISISVVLLGIYITFIISLVKVIMYIFYMFNVINITPEEQLLILIIVSLPLACWLVGFKKALNSLEFKSEERILLHRFKASNYFSQIYDNKRKLIRSSWIFLISGLITVGFILGISFLSSTNSSIYGWDAITLIERGNYLNNLEEYETALKVFSNATEIAPWQARAWNGKAFALAGLGKTNESLKAYDTALRIDSKNQFAWAQQGAIFEEWGNIKQL